MSEPKYHPTWQFYSDKAAEAEGTKLRPEDKVYHPSWQYYSDQAAKEEEKFNSKICFLYDD